MEVVTSTTPNEGDDVDNSQLYQQLLDQQSLILKTEDFEQTNNSCILSIEEVFCSLNITEGAKKSYFKAWNDFINFCPDSSEFETRNPTEEEICGYFTHLRFEFNRPVNSLLTLYSQLKNVIEKKTFFSHGRLLQLSA